MWMLLLTGCLQVPYYPSEPPPFDDTDADVDLLCSETGIEEVALTIVNRDAVTWIYRTDDACRDWSIVDLDPGESHDLLTTNLSVFVARDPDTLEVIDRITAVEDGTWRLR